MNGTTISAAAYNSDYTKEGTSFFTAGAPEASLEDLKSQYSGWEQEVQDILSVRSIPLVLIGRGRGLTIDTSARRIHLDGLSCP